MTKKILARVFSMLVLAIGIGLIIALGLGFVLYGTTLLLSEVLEGRVWLGFLITGGVCLAAVSAFLKWGMGSNDEKEKANETSLSSIDFLKTAQNHPFSSAGAAALVGYLMAGNIPGAQDKRRRGASVIEEWLNPILLPLADLFFQGTLLPRLQEFFASLKKEEKPE